MLRSLANKKDHLLVSVIGVVFGAFAVPILENVKPPHWQLSFTSVTALIVGFALFANFAIWIAGLLGKKWPGLFQFAKYAATGAMNSFTDLGLFNLFSLIFQIFAGPLIIVFNVISFSVAVTNSYFWNNLWAFKREGSKLSVREFFRFFGITVSGVVLNTAIVYVVTTVIGAPEGFTGGQWENVAKLVAVPTSVIWNFIGYKLFVFKNKPIDQNPIIG